MLELANIDILACPVCKRQVSPNAQVLRCPSCDLDFPVRAGIAYLLPPNVADRQTKETEREGWRKVFENRGWVVLPEDILSYPESRKDEFWQKAAEAMPLADKVLDPLQGKRGVDIASGMGWAAARFARGGASVLALDFNDTPYNGLEGAISVRKCGVHFDAVCCDCEVLPIVSGSLDFAFICSALHHLTHPDAALKECYRVLKPDGVLVDICEAFRTALSTPENEHGTDFVEFRSSGVNEQAYTQKQYEALFKEAGFDLLTLFPRYDAPVEGLPVQQWINSGAADAINHHHQHAPLKRLLMQVLLKSPVWRLVRWKKLHLSMADRVFVATRRR